MDFLAEKLQDCYHNYEKKKCFDAHCGHTYQTSRVICSMVHWRKILVDIFYQINYIWSKSSYSLTDTIVPYPFIASSLLWSISLKHSIILFSVAEEWNAESLAQFDKPEVIFECTGVSVLETDSFYPLYYEELKQLFGYRNDAVNIVEVRMMEGNYWVFLIP